MNRVSLGVLSHTLAFLSLIFFGALEVQASDKKSKEQILQEQIRAEKSPERRFVLQKSLLKQMKIAAVARKNYDSYEAELSKSINLSKKKGVWSAQTSDQVTSDLTRLYSQLVEAEYQKALSKKANPRQRLATIALIKRYEKRALSQVDSDEQRDQWQLRRGVLSQLNRDHLQALREFSALLKKHEDRKQGTFGAKVLNHAMISSHTRSEWATTTRFETQPKKLIADRKALRSLYEMKLAADDRPAVAWLAVAQMGLLSINLGQTEQAIAQWESYIFEKSSRNNIAAEISGYLLNYYEARQDWKSLEKLSSFLLKKNMNARHASVNIVVQDTLARALFHLGMSAQLSSDFNAADGYLTRIVELAESKASGFALSKLEEVRFNLASVKKSKGDHDAAEAQLKLLVSEFPKSRYAAESYSLMGNWALERAHEEDAMRAFDKVRDQFSSSQFSRAAREKLSQLYFSRGFTDVAVTIDRELAADKRISKAERTIYVNSALEKIQIDGSASEIMSVVAFAKSNGFTSEQTMTLVAQSEVSALNQKENVGRDEYKLLRKRIESMALMDQDTRDSLAKLVFENTSRRSEVKREEVYSATLKNPAAAMDAEWQYYLSLKQGFVDVCDLGSNLYCAPAHLGRAALAESFSERMERFNIASTLAKDLVDTFNNRKSNMLANLKKEHEESISTAGSVVVKMHTQPAWVQAVLWETSADWNFDRLTEEMKNSMIQARPKDLLSRSSDSELIGKLE